MTSSSRYLVVKFLVLPYEDIDRYVYVPESWQRWQDPDGEVAIAYPEEKPEDTSARALKYEDCSKRWKIYMAKKCYEADSYEDALHFIFSLVENKSEDIINKLQDMGIGNSVKDSNQNKSKSTPKSNSIKRKTINNTPLTPTPKTVQKDTEEITPSTSTPKIDKRDTKKIIPSTSTPKIDKKDTKEMTPSTFTPKMVKKDTEEISPSTPTTKIVKEKIEKSFLSLIENYKQNLSEEINNQETGNEKIKVNTTPQNKNKKSQYKIPEDFNPEDLKDMFRHNSPILGEVVELLPKTGVFIEVNVLKTKFKNYSDMAEGLMKGIFTNKALNNCTMSGEPPIAKNHSNSDIRPALDQDAREAIIKYVYDNCYKDWKEGRNSIEYAMRKVLTKSRSKQ